MQGGGRYRGLERIFVLDTFGKGKRKDIYKVWLRKKDPEKLNDA